MGSVAKSAVNKVLALMAAPPGLSSSLAALSRAENTTLAELPARQMVAQNVAADVAERSKDWKYPSLSVYCEKIRNDLKEKFRAVSGSAVLVVEVRVSQDRLEAIEGNLQMYVEAVTQVLNGNRGDWGEGMFYGGGYEVTFQPVKHGGRNFVQTAKISFEMGVSK